MANDVGLKPPDVKPSGDLGGKHGHSVNSGPTNINKRSTVNKTYRFYCDSNQMFGI